MGKYDRLHSHLKTSGDDVWRASFADLEKILGFKLPASARNYTAWWANQQPPTAQSSAWLNAGWITSELDLGAEKVKFRRNTVARPRGGINPARANRNPTADKGTSVPHLWDEPRYVECQIEMNWVPLGNVIADADGRLIFPKGGNAPAIYCFRIRAGNREARYIGETDNLARRLAHYRNPGPTQATNIRLNAKLKEALTAGAEIAISAVTGEAWVNCGKGRISADMSSKAVRCLLENAAICEIDAVEIDCLNRAVAELD